MTVPEMCPEVNLHGEGRGREVQPREGGLAAERVDDPPGVALGALAKKAWPLGRAPFGLQELLDR